MPSSPTSATTSCPSARSVAGAVQANWFQEIALPEEDLDPFAVEERGLPIEVGDEEARLSRALMETMRKEGVYADRGITCAIKDRPDTTCWACPVFKADTTHSLSALCRLGREQDRLVTRQAALTVERKQKKREEVA